MAACPLPASLIPLLAALALLSTSAPALALDDTSACTLCAVPATAGGEDRTLAQWACYAVSTIACDTEDTCWIDTTIDLIVSVSRTIVQHGPPLLACAGHDCAAGPSLMLGIFYIAAAILLGLHALHYWFPREKPVDWHYTLVRILIGGTLAYVLGAGFAQTLWTIAGAVLSLGAIFGNEILVSTATVSCNAPAPTTDIGWSTTLAITNALFRHVVDIAAVLTGIAITLIPDIGAVFEAYGRIAAGIATMNLEPVFEVLRFMFAFVLLMSAVTIITLFFFTIIEALVTTSITFALSPLIAVLWIWTGMRSAAHAALAAVLYTTVMLAIIGITLTITHRTVESSLAQFTTHILNPHYNAAENPCTDTAGTLYQSMRRYMCLVDAPPDSDGDAATLIDSSITEWLPALLVILLTTILAAAILKYASTAASELTGHQQTHTLAAQVLDQAKSLGSRGIGKLRLR